MAQMIQFGDTLYLAEDKNIIDIKVGDLIKIRDYWCLVQDVALISKDGVIDLEIFKNGGVLNLSVPEGVTLRTARRARGLNIDPIFTFEGRDFYPLRTNIRNLQIDDAMQVGGEWYFVHITHPSQAFGHEIRLRSSSDDSFLVMFVADDQLYTIGRA